MTDPLSITTAVLGILGQSIQGIQAVQKLFNQYKIAELTLAATRTECSAIRVALLQIQTLMTNRNLTKDPLGKSKDSDDPMTLTFDEYEAVISACSLTFAVLNQRIEELDVYGFDPNRQPSTKAKLKSLWNDDEMNLLRSNIRGQATAITVLLAAFQAETSTKTYQLLREEQNKRILGDVSDAARTLISKSQRARTITMKRQHGDEENDDDDDDSLIGDEVFDFDDIIINSAAYRRAYYSFNIKARQQRRKNDKNLHNKKGSPEDDTAPTSLDARPTPENTGSLQQPQEAPNPRLKEPERSTDLISPAPPSLGSDWTLVQNSTNSAISINVKDLFEFHDEDYFDVACQNLFDYVRQWALRFSKFSDTQSCRRTIDISDEKLIDRLDLLMLDGVDVDVPLSDRVKRRDVFTALICSMIWEYVFNRYLFGLDREMRQKLKSLEKLLSEVSSGPHNTTALCRALHCQGMLKQPSFVAQLQTDVEAVTEEIYKALFTLLPPPISVEGHLKSSLKSIITQAANLSHEMRTQWAEYIMLPPLQPEYDVDGNVVSQHSFSAPLMNPVPGCEESNEDLQRQGATISMILFPLVVKKGEDNGTGEDEVVICPAQVIVNRGGKSMT